MAITAGRLVFLSHMLTQGMLRCTQHTILCTALQVHTKLVRGRVPIEGIRAAVAQKKVSTEAGSYIPCHWDAPEILNPQHPP